MEKAEKREQKAADVGEAKNILNAKGTHW